jgi:hypothetical protein
VEKKRVRQNLFDLRQQFGRLKYMGIPQFKVLMGKENIDLSPETRKVIINKGLL